MSAAIDNMKDGSTNSQTAAQDLRLIRDMMARGASSVQQSGLHLMLWGILLGVAYFAQYYLLTRNFPGLYHAVLWVGITGIGWLGSIWLGVYLQRQIGQAQSRFPLVAGVWMAMGISLTLYFAAGLMSRNFDPLTITLLATALLGTSFLITSMLTGIQWMKFIAAAWWLLLAFFSTLPSLNHEHLLVLGLANWPLIFLPGLLLERQRRRQAD